MKWLTPEQYADVMQIAVWSVRELCRTGQLRCKKVGQQWRIHPSEVE